MRRLPPHLAPAGYSPARYVPLSPAPVSDQGQRLTVIQAVQRLFANGENGGYWPADPAYLYEDSAGTIPASVNGVCGLWANNVTGKPNAVQATTANKPYLRRTPTSQKYWLDSNTATGALTATFASALGSACTIANVGAEGVTIAENQTVGTTYNLTPPYGYNGDVLIINRALTAVEKALVTRVLRRNVPTLGSNLVNNGAFDTGISGWVLATPSRGTASWDNGRLKIDATAGDGFSPYVYTVISVQVGVCYLAQFDFTSPDGSGGFAYLNYSAYSASLIVNNKYRAALFVTGAASAFGIYGLGLKTSYYDNISLKAIL